MVATETMPHVTMMRHIQTLAPTRFMIRMLGISNNEELRKKSPAPQAKAVSEIPTLAWNCCFANPMLARSRKATTYISNRKGSSRRRARAIARDNTSPVIGIPMSRLLLKLAEKQLRQKQRGAARQLSTAWPLQRHYSAADRTTATGPNSPEGSRGESALYGVTSA